MKIRVIESDTNAPDKHRIFICNKEHHLVLILKATTEELLALAENEGKKSKDLVEE